MFFVFYTSSYLFFWILKRKKFPKVFVFAANCFVLHSVFHTSPDPFLCFLSLQVCAQYHIKPSAFQSQQNLNHCDLNQAHTTRLWFGDLLHFIVATLSSWRQPSPLLVNSHSLLPFSLPSSPCGNCLLKHEWRLFWCDEQPAPTASWQHRLRARPSLGGLLSQPALS